MHKKIIMFILLAMLPLCGLSQSTYDILRIDKGTKNIVNWDINWTNYNVFNGSNYFSELTLNGDTITAWPVGGAGTPATLYLTIPTDTNDYYTLPTPSCTNYFLDKTNVNNSLTVIYGSVTCFVNGITTIQCLPMTNIVAYPYWRIEY